MTTPGPVARDVLQTLDDVRSRTRQRLDGLTDAEYLWQPVPACLTVRPAGEGTFRADQRPPEDASPAAFTTIAWRMWHIGADCLRSYGRFFGDEPQRSELPVWPGTAAAGIRELARDWDGFRAHVEALGDDRLLQPMGPAAGPYADESYLQLALHALDEAAHHGAELGVLRDLYRHGFGRGSGSGQAAPAAAP